MSSLYRIYRPASFTSVIGQDHIRDSLMNSLAREQVGHAYLFSGPRGTGKTTLARLFAKAVNCPSRIKSGEACNACEICQEIARGQAVDIIEIDAASNRGIDEIRELRERIAFAPTRAAYKVYIIDEVHMLTKEAFNALLKTLEEPPKHAVFILATTELHKVPDTIISRCQRYQFHRASDESLTKLLAEVAAKEKIEVEAEALMLIAKRAEGSFRDALTLLGNLSSQKEKINAGQLRVLMGLPPSEIVATTYDLLCHGETEKLIVVLKRFIDEGGDLSVLVKHLADQAKEDIFESNDAQSLGSATLILEQLLLALGRARFTTDPTALLLARLVSIAGSFSHRPTAVPVTAAAPTVTDLQKKVDKPAPEEAPVSVDAVVAQPPAVPIANREEFWERFLNEMKKHNHALYMLVRSVHLEELTSEKIVLAVKFRFYSERMFELKNRRIIESAASLVTGNQLKLECQVRADLDQPVAKQGSDDLVSAVVDVFEIGDPSE